MNTDHSMNYIESNDGIEPIKKQEYLFNAAGQNLESPKEKVYGKIVAKSNRDYYYIRVHQNVPYDPLGAYSKREQYLETEMEQVSKVTFDFYMLYLKTKNSIYMTRARRGLLDD